MLGRILDAGIIGALTGGALAAIIWAIDRLRGVKPREKLTREQMIVRLQEIADDPESTPDARDQALDRLRAFGMR